MRDPLYCVNHMLSSLQPSELRAAQLVRIPDPGDDEVGVDSISGPWTGNLFREHCRYLANRGLSGLLLASMILGADDTPITHSGRSAGQIVVMLGCLSIGNHRKKRNVMTMAIRSQLSPGPGKESILFYAYFSFVRSSPLTSTLILSMD